MIKENNIPAVRKKPETIKQMISSKDISFEPMLVPVFLRKKLLLEVYVYWDNQVRGFVARLVKRRVLRKGPTGLPEHVDYCLLVLETTAGRELYLRRVIRVTLGICRVG